MPPTSPYRANRSYASRRVLVGMLVSAVHLAFTEPQGGSSGNEGVQAQRKGWYIGPRRLNQVSIHLFKMVDIHIGGGPAACWPYLATTVTSGSLTLGPSQRLIRSRSGLRANYEAFMSSQ